MSFKKIKFGLAKLPLYLFLFTKLFFYNFTMYLYTTSEYFLIIKLNLFDKARIVLYLFNNVLICIKYTFYL